MKNALHLLVSLDEQYLAVMRNTRPDSPMYQDSLKAHWDAAKSVRNLMATCQVDQEDRELFAHYMEGR